MFAKSFYVLLMVAAVALSSVANGLVTNWLAAGGQLGWNEPASNEPESSPSPALSVSAAGPPRLLPLNAPEQQSLSPVATGSKQGNGDIRIVSHSVAAAVTAASIAETGTPPIKVAKIADGDYDWIQPQRDEIPLITHDVTIHFAGLKQGETYDVCVNGRPTVASVTAQNPQADLSGNLPAAGKVEISVLVRSAGADAGAGADADADADAGTNDEDEACGSVLTTLILPSSPGSITTPRITEYAVNEFTAPAPRSTVVLFGDRPYLRLLGRDRSTGADFQLLHTRENGGRQEIRELPSQLTVTAIPSIPGAWQTQFTLDLPTSDYTPSDIRNHHLRVLSRQEGQHVYSIPLDFQKHDIARANKPVLSILPDTLTPNDGAYRINRLAWQVRATLQPQVLPHALLVVRNPQKREPLSVVNFDATSKDFEVGNLSPGTQQLTAEIWQGNVRLADAKSVPAVSDPIRVDVRTQGPRVERVEPENFGTAPGVRTLNISFTPENPLRLDGDETAIEGELEAAIKLRPSGADGTFAFSSDVPPAQFEARFNPQSNTVSLRFSTLEAALYQLTITGLQLTDVYGNKLEGQEGQPGSNYVMVLGQRDALTELATSEPSVRPGITGSTGDYVQFPEFTEPRTVPDGFNPHDKVETRVARLYYYRDAHRVAQIINRRVKSHNRQGVDMERQLADKSRTLADQVTAARQAAERQAITQAQATRRIENQLEAAQRSLDQTLDELTTARRSGEPEAIVAPLDLAAQTFARQIEDLQTEVEHARELEIAATEEAQRLESDERLARAEQFRREVAAGHADPDTYAPGRPTSPDPVEQVSVSVIGEGLIHLRGPIKGINTVRMMIDQIDSPVGQTRISVHTVQINGEDESRMEDVANVVQMHIDQSRFLTLQSSEMLRRAVVQVAARKAEEAWHLNPGQTQEDRDRRYLYAFFGRDFIDELVTLDSEFLRTGNKLLSLHSMDSTSLSSALNLMALAKNSTREEILAEFDMMVHSELPAAEGRYLEAGITTGKQHMLDFRHPPEFYPLAQRAKFESLRAFFSGQIAHDDTLTPLQREFIRLAQIFKSRLITEIEYKQRVMERAVIEERLGDRDKELQEARKKEQAANDLLARTEQLVNAKRQNILVALAEFTGVFFQLERDFDALADYAEPFRFNLDAGSGDFLRSTTGNLTIEGTDVAWEWDINQGRIKLTGSEDNTDLWRRHFSAFLAQARESISSLRRFKFKGRNRELLSTAETRLSEVDRVDVDPFDPLNLYALSQIFRIVRDLSAVVLQDVEPLHEHSLRLVDRLGQPGADISAIFQEWTSLRGRVLEKVESIDDREFKERALRLVKSADESFRDILPLGYQLEIAQREAEAARRPLDHKKFLDMLIDQLEEKYIELLEGTRAHTANVDNYLKRLTTALDDDFNTQFYNPTFRYVREASTYWDVQFGQTETTSILANNREFAKVSPSATMEFDLPKRDILINEALNGAMANVQDFGALLNDPTFLAAAQMQGPQSTATPPRGSTSGFGVVRNVLPGLDSGTSEQILSQSADGRPQFGANLENLIPDPAIYKFETGTGYEIRPVIQPDGQAVVFDFNYMYTTNIREPVRADEKHLGRVKRHYIDTDVQLSNFELREVSRYTVALKAARTSQGVPLLQDIPVVGALWRPLPSQESSLQQNVIMAQATIFPTLFDLMGLRWAPAVADLDPLRLSNEEFTARGRHRALQNRVYDHSSSKVDEFLRIPESDRRPDLYRTQETIPGMHPNGYQGPGLDLQDSQLQEGYQPERAYPEQTFVPPASKEGAIFLPGRRHGHAAELHIDDYPLETAAPGEPDPEPVLEPPYATDRRPSMPLRP